MRNLPRTGTIAGLAVVILGGGATARGDTPTNDATASAAGAANLSQDSVFSSFKQALNKGSDQEVVRGHFEVGTAPNVHRYYCLVNPKTGVREPNGVLGDLVPHPDGMTGLNNETVSFYSCAKAEKLGLLVTTGYVVTGAAAATSSSAPSAATPTMAAAPLDAAKASAAPSAATPTMAAAPSVNLTPTQIDVAGVRLGMSPDEVREVLKSKKLLEYNESDETLSYLDSGTGVVRPVPNGRFVNRIAAWTPPPSSAASDSFEVSGESYEVMFTPVPGQERAMGIVHSVGSVPADAVHELALESGLAKKYGGFADMELPQSPTWRLQRGGNVQVGDPCNRRGVLGGLGSLTFAGAPRENIALKKTPEEFGYQIAHCGVAIITEDHFTANGGALSADRLVTRYTVTAYSPSFGLEGAEAASRLIHAAGGSARKTDAARVKDPASSL